MMALPLKADRDGRRSTAGDVPPWAKPDFDQAPFLVIWETTQACDLACRHCRADARPWRHPEELSTDEARRLLDSVREFGPILFVFSGGDALKRPDIVDLTRHGAGLGLRMAITPATTPLCTPSMIGELKKAGMSRLAVSLDGATAGVHDAFRQVDGSFQHGIRILETARAEGLSTQVNSVIARHNVHELGGFARLLRELEIVFWEVFFLVPVGRASRDDVATAREFEEVMEDLYELSKSVPFDIKATAAPHYQRVVIQTKARDAGEDITQADPLTTKSYLSRVDGIGRARGVNDGDGFLFVSHTGEIFPSGFLPLSAGNVRTHDLVQVYREAPLFRRLRDRRLLKGKCGVCEFKALCGGSRARAYAVTCDYLAAEPYCSYLPPG